MTIRHAIAHAGKSLQEAKISSAQLDAQLIVGFVVGRDRAWLLAHDDTELASEQVEQINALIVRRESREPLVHLTGTREFYGLDLKITPDVLTPRVETEQMAEWAIKYAPANSSLIDIGTGSGALAIAIAMHRLDLKITAAEVSHPALEVARENAEAHQVQMELIESDLWSEIKGTYSTVVTNLPYLRDDAREELMEEVKHEPDVALFGGDDGLDLYRRFLIDLPTHLEPGGYLFTECDPWQHEELIAEAGRIGLVPIEQGYFILGFKRNS